MPSSIQTPQDLANWLSNSFSYGWEFPDKWQMPQETIDLKKGDCEDFAILSSAFLTRLGISNDIIILKFRNLKISHALCIWKGQDGSYNFISNRRLHRTGKKSLKKAIKKFYPDCEEIIFPDPYNQYKWTIRRKI